MTPLKGAFGMGVKKKLWAGACGAAIARASRTVQERDNRDKRVGIQTSGNALEPQDTPSCVGPSKWFVEYQHT
jgi:hypothetical protein